jgi:hypothetical protein
MWQYYFRIQSVTEIVLLPAVPEPEPEPKPEPRPKLQPKPEPPNTIKKRINHFDWFFDA